MPRLTVLMPTYNVARWVEEAIRSVLNQTYGDFELLVVDDGSTDETAALVSRISDPRLRLVRFEENVGLAENLNRGLDMIETELVARMDGDDIAMPDWLETGVRILDSHPTVGICSFGFRFFGARTSTVRFPERHADSLAQMLFGCTVIVPVFRRTLFAEQNLRYRTSAFPAEDYRLWAEAYPHTEVYNVQRTLFLYRTHPTQISTARRSAQKTKSDEVRLLLLRQLGEAFSTEDEEYFLGRFVPGEIKSEDDIRRMQSFAQKMVQKNSGALFSTDALRRKLKNHISLSALDYAIQAFFSERYTPSGLVRLIGSGFYPLLPKKNRRKIILKCFLLRRK